MAAEHPSTGIESVPAPASGSMLGRDEAVAEVARLLHVARLVTLTGAPGIGKSRLALGVAGLLGGGYSDGTRLVELASITRSADVPRALATALSIDELPGQTLTETIVARLHHRRILLVLDNCEHVIGACADLARSVLAGSQELRILATSRQALALPEERVWRVDPLPVPAPEEGSAPEQLARYASVLLFLSRAGVARPGFALTPGAAPAVAEICRRLDGIPLALELAAARVDSLDPGEIARRLDDRFELLTAGNGGEPAHHQTLEAALDWSHELLSDRERALLRRLSVFAGGFDSEAAEAVCGSAAVDRDGKPVEGEVARLLAGLVAKSLVVSERASPPASRYRLLETIRAYAGKRLEESGETVALRDAHARFYLSLAERAEPELTGPEQERWLGRLEDERASLRSALDWSIARGEPEQALRLAGALVLFWRVRCHFSEGREALEAAVTAGNGAPPAARAKALWGAGFMAYMAGDGEGARPALEESLAHWEELGNDEGRARALLLLGNGRLFCADPAGLALLEESAAAARTAGDSWCLGHALALTGFEHASLGRLHAARPAFEECLEVARAARDRQALRFGLIGLGLVSVRQGDYGLAQPLLEEALAVTDELGESYGKATALCYLGELALARGEYGRACDLLDEAIAVFSELGPREKIIEPLMLLAWVAKARGDLPRARRLFEEALELAGTGTFTEAIQGLAEIAIAEGDVDEGRRLLTSARDLARGIGDDRSVARALHALGQLARASGEAGRAAALHNEALELQRQIGDAPGIVASLEAIAGLAAAAGRHRHAARLLGAANALREQRSYARAPLESTRYHADLALVRNGLSAEECEAARAEGAGLTIDTAITQALKGRRRRGRPAAGWPSLTEREREIAALVAEGLTNPQIAERLFVTTGTVKTHLSHIFKKLEVRSRREVEREVLRRREHPSPRAALAP